MRSNMFALLNDDASNGSPRCVLFINNASGSVYVSCCCRARRMMLTSLMSMMTCPQKPAQMTFMGEAGERRGG
jgi:hypothetical protein